MPEANASGDVPKSNNNALGPGVGGPKGEIANARPLRAVKPDHGSDFFLVRVGLHGQVGRFRRLEPEALQRGQRVVCRTLRGIEVGQVLCPTAMANRFLSPGALTSEGQQPDEDWFDGRILRRMTPEDELLWGHLQQLAGATLDECESWLQQSSRAVTLLEVEPLLDGKTLYFHFLEQVDRDLELQLDVFVQVYERKVRESQFARLLEHGCGPGCGTSQAVNGCGSRGGCSVCKIANACKASEVV